MNTSEKQDTLLQSKLTTGDFQMATGDFQMATAEAIFGAGGEGAGQGGQGEGCWLVTGGNSGIGDWWRAGEERPG